MTPKDVQEYYGNGYRFEKQTGMSHSSFHNWRRKNRIPFVMQLKIQYLTKGKLIAEMEDE